MRPRLIGRIAAAAMVAALAMAGTALAQAAPGPSPVGVIMLERQAVQRRFTLPGRAVASQEVAIRPRVSGVVTEILYQAGTPVTKGAPLFRLDQASYVAALSSANAALARAEAMVPVSAAALDRAVALEGTGSSRATVEAARATAAQAVADVASAKAALQLATTELSWTAITSPIDGIAGIAAVSVGDLVTASQADALATVTTIDPIFVDMYEPAARILSVRDQIEAGALTLNERLEATLTLEGGYVQRGGGTIVAQGFDVSTTTGTQDFRFRFDNPDLRILPGMFVRGEVELGTVEAFLVPQRAATRGRDGGLTAFVVADGKAASRTLVTSGTEGSNWIVTDGVAEGEALIVDGLARLAEGAAVAPVPVTIDAEGVVRDAKAAE